MAYSGVMELMCKLVMPWAFSTLNVSPNHMSCSCVPSTSTRFFFGALGIQRHQTGQNLLVTQRVRPAIGLKRGAVDLLVKFFDNQHKPAMFDVFVFRRERGTAFEFFEDIIEASER
jgi:hypothetical protein